MASKVDEIPFTFEVDGVPFTLTLRGDEMAGLTPREWGYIVRNTSLKGAADVQDALDHYDPEFVAVLAWIATKRAGQTIDLEAVLDDTVKARLVDADVVPPTADAVGAS